MSGTGAKGKREESLARVVAWAVQDRARALRDEIARPWTQGRRTPEAATGRRIGLGLALGGALLGIGLAIYSEIRSR